MHRSIDKWPWDQSESTCGDAQSMVWSSVDHRRRRVRLESMPQCRSESGEHNGFDRSRVHRSEEEESQLRDDAHATRDLHGCTVNRLGFYSVAQRRFGWDGFSPLEASAARCPPDERKRGSVMSFRCRGDDRSTWIDFDQYWILSKKLLVQRAWHQMKHYRT